MQNDESASDFYEAAANAISKKDSLAQSSQSLNQGNHFDVHQSIREEILSGSSGWRNPEKAKLARSRAGNL
jgi:hypothetical protein